MLALDRFDFAIFVVTPDDLNTSRGSTRPSARDNVIFELGLFMGALGRDRTYILRNRSAQLSLPSDLAGITVAEYAPHSTGNWEAALGAPCARIQAQIDKHGIREARRAARLDQATTSMQDAGMQMQALVKLMARSRKVELDIITNQFGAMMSAQGREDILRDLRELESVLSSESVSTDVTRAIMKALSAASAKTSTHLNETEVASAVENARRKAPARSNTEGWRSQILWVDDRPENNTNERRAFESLGMVFTLALSTQQALELVKINTFAAIISDMGRREGPREGYVLLDALRANGNDIPLFIYASSSAPEHKRETLKHGGQGCTNNPQELFEMVTRTVVPQ